MFTRKNFRFLLQSLPIILAVVLLLSGCATQDSTTEKPDSTATPVPSATLVPKATMAPEQKIESSPTSIPIATALPADQPLEALASILGNLVNIRSGPGTTYPVLQTLAYGESAPALGFNEGRSWVQIELADGKQGWVSADLVDVTNAENIKTVTEITAPSTAADTEQQAVQEPSTSLPENTEQAAVQEPSTFPTAASEQTAVQEPSTSPVENTEQTAVQEPPVPADVSASRGNTVDAFQCANGCAEPPDPSCTIKGNVNSKGERIYHVPGGAFYNRTDINPSEGDLWFCSAADAQAAGFRPSQR